MEKQMLKAADVAPALGVTASRVHQMVRAGELPSVRVGKRGVRIPRASFDEYLARKQAEADASVNAPMGEGAALFLNHPALKELRAFLQAQAARACASSAEQLRGFDAWRNAQGR